MSRISKLAVVVTAAVSIAACDQPLHLSPDATLPDGSTYVGDIVDGVFHGEGTWKFKEGSFYVGQFSEGLMHGQGRFEDRYGEVYEGDFSAGVATGQFTVSSKDPVYQYEGALRDWRFNGQGSYQSEQEQYSGEFLNGYYHGTGTLTARDGSGSVYTGQFDRGEFHGNGVYEAGGARWDGEFVTGEFKGVGSHTDAEGKIYQGEFESWVLSGERSLTSTEGDVQSGHFEYGYLSGPGKIVKANGETYTGSFDYGSLNGEGEHLIPGVSKYTGEFSYGNYSGQGRLEKYDNGEVSETLDGKWRGGKYLGAGENPLTQGEVALVSHTKLLAESLENLLVSNPKQANVYFLGVAGDGSQSVFKRELGFVKEAVRARYSTAGRELELVNHHTSAAEYPLVTRASIAAAISGIAEKMDVEKDILIAYFTSHGSSDHRLSLKHNDIKLSSISAKELGDQIKQSAIKWKVMFVSACYAGGFIPELEDETTMVLTAADAENNSFGCSEESDGTYFGKAFFLETLAKDPDISLQDAFKNASEIIKGWESEKELDPSNPQFSSTELIEQKLAELNR